MPRKMKESGVEWLGQIPEGWGVRRNKYCYACGKEIVGSKSSDTTLLSLTTRGVKEKPAGAVGGKQPETFDTYQVVRPNDIVLCLFDLDCSAVFSGISHYDGMISPAYKVVSCKRFVCSQYAEYWFRFVSEGRKFKAYAKNLRYTLSYEEFETLPMLCPPLPEQERIAAFLDERCAKIDGMIAEAKASIEDYKKWKQSIIFEAVTGKHEKNLKPSGVDWIGDVPEGWKVCRIVNLYSEVSERGSDELPILSVSINTGVSDKELSEEEQERVFLRSEDRTKYKRVQPGDLTYNMMRAWQGAFGAVRVDGMVSPAYVVARPKVDMDSRYVEYLLRTPNATEEMKRFSHGITDFRLRLYWPEFKDIKIPCPNVKEQKQIADYIDEKCAAIDKLVGEKEALIADLEAYKKSLIFETVTGKREVV